MSSLWRIHRIHEEIHVTIRYRSCKKTVRVTLICILLLAGTATLLRADIIPDGHHFVNREVSLTNLKDFPEFLLVGYITGPMIDGYEIQIIEDNVPLDKGYKFNAYKLFAILKSLAEQAGGVENIDLKKIADTTPPVEILDPGDQYVPDDNPLSEEYYYYTIIKATDETLNIKLTRQVLKYQNGQPDKTINY